LHLGGLWVIIFAALWYLQLIEIGKFKVEGTFLFSSLHPSATQANFSVNHYYSSEYLEQVVSEQSSEIRKSEFTIAVDIAATDPFMLNLTRYAATMG
jgi:hypothetical protein